MKQHHLLLFAFTGILFACNEPQQPAEDNNPDTVYQPVVVDTTSRADSTLKDTTQPVFDITSIPVSTQDIGQFPFFSAPEGYKFLNSETKDFDKQYVAVNGKLIPMEGKVFNANLEVDRLTNKSKFNAPLLEKAMVN